MSVGKKPYEEERPTRRTIMIRAMKALGDGRADEQPLDVFNVGMVVDENIKPSGRLIFAEIIIPTESGLYAFREDCSPIRGNISKRTGQLKPEFYWQYTPAYSIPFTDIIDWKVVENDGKKVINIVTKSADIIIFGPLSYTKEGSINKADLSDITKYLPMM